MPAPLRVVGLASGWIVLLGFGWSAAAQAQEAPLVVTYGPAASTAEGDPDFREVIFLSVPDGLEDRLYLRVFDPDTGGEHDLVYDAADDTQVRFTLFGGEGAYTGAAGAGVEPGAEQLAAGHGARRAGGRGRAPLWTTAGRRCSRSRPSRARRSAAGGFSACRSRAWPATTPICTASP